MPYKIEKRKCKQASGQEGNYVLLKADTGEYVSCHVTEELAKKAIAARHIRENVIQEFLFEVQDE